MPSRRSRDRSIGHMARAQWSGERATPTVEQQTPFFHVGLVMDDQDDQRMGRLWVYIPSFSTKRFDENSTPNYGGTTPDRQSGRLELDTRLRNGWIQCYPMMPFFGGDDYRVEEGPDGRNSKQGDTNAYGFWYQPRIGDYVGVMFENAEPSGAYWVGCIPKQYRNFAVPGASGRLREVVSDQSGNLIKDNVAADALIPVLDKARTPENPFADGPFPSNEFGVNLMESGMISDTHRGAGTNSARRESPSYVLGLKSPGWNFQSERFNKDVDGSQFEQRITELEEKNSMGHQLVMDDHPDYQGIRIRTSQGSQILFDDSCDSPFIFVNTPKGKVWIEMVDTGNMNVYAKGSISFRAESDINLTAGRDVNIEALRNMKVNVRGEQEMRVAGQSNWQFTGNQTVQNIGDLNHRIDGTFHHEVVTDRYDRIGGNMFQETIGEYNLRSTGDQKFTTEGSQYEVAALRSEEAGSIFMNSGIRVEATVSEVADTPSFTPLVNVPGAPDTTQIRTGTEPGSVQHLAPIVPQHQPWAGRCGRTRRFSGFVTAVDTAGVRRGASTSTATAPLDQTGTINGQAGRHTGLPFNSQNLGEAPLYSFSEADPGELNAASTYSLSDAGADFIRSEESLSLTPYRDSGGRFAIGYGHNIVKGDTINGVLVDDDFLQALERSNGSNLVIDEAEAERLFALDVAKFEQSVRDNVTTDITQGQFDAMTSLSYNIGTGAFANSTLVNELNAGRNENVPEQWMRWVRADGEINNGLISRRRSELEQLWSV